jgi:hypothetical protein
VAVAYRRIGAIGRIVAPTLEISRKSAVLPRARIPARPAPGCPTPLVAEPEKALDHLELLLKILYYVSAGWLKIDPNFDPLRKNPRFQRFVAGGK